MPLGTEYAQKILQKFPEGPNDNNNGLDIRTMNED